MRISKFAGLALVVTLAAAGCASPQPTADPRAAGPAAAPAAEIPGAESSAPAPADQRSTGDPVPTAAETAPAVGQSPAPQAPASQAPASQAPASQAPAATTAASVDPTSFEGAVLDTSGLGPIKFGMSAQTAVARGWLVPAEHCGPWKTAPALEAKGVALILSGDDNIIEIHLSDGHFATRSGFRVGQTYGELRRIYGDDVKVRNKDGNGGPFQAATIIAGGRELVFFKDWDEKDYSASTRITSILLMPPSSGIYGEC